MRIHDRKILCIVSIFSLFSLLSIETTNALGQIWTQTFEGGLGGEPPLGTGRHSLSGCGKEEITSSFSHRGNRSDKMQVITSPCPAYTLRYYPTWDGNFRLPVLVNYWLYMDAASWQSAAGDRFSPLTLKETSGVTNASIVTTHVLGDGSMDCGHCTMSFRSASVKVPMKKWNLQSAYLENKKDANGNIKTHIAVWVDGQLAVRGIIENTFKEGFLKHWHMGLYGDNNGMLTMYNDDIKISEVGDETEAVKIIGQELGASLPPTGKKCDLNNDNKLDVVDLGILLSNWNKSGNGDCDNDGKVDIIDLGILLSNWGK